MDTNLPTTLNSAFFAHLSNPTSSSQPAVRLRGETWSFHDVYAISTGVALELHKKYGPRPKVAILSPNHPYILVVMLAAWRLGGIVIPIDRNTPEHLLKPMLKSNDPNVVVIQEDDESTKALGIELGLPVHAYGGSQYTMTALLRSSVNPSDSLSLPSSIEVTPKPTDICFRVYTSSATNISNLKCVPLSHLNVLGNITKHIEWLRRMFPGETFEREKVLGWSPWSHLFAITFDLILSVFVLEGCYIFSVVPPGYGAGSSPDPAKPAHDSAVAQNRTNGPAHTDPYAELLSTLLTVQPTLFAGVPLILSRIKSMYTIEPSATRKSAILSALRGFKVFIAGGAAVGSELVKWAEGEVGLKLFNRLGMTETGPLFIGRIRPGEEGWLETDCLVPDAELRLLRKDGSVLDGEGEGELCITSAYLSRGYLYHDSTAFTVSSDGDDRRVTFRTGDIYERFPNSNGDGRIVWRGRKEDYIQLCSGETLDPRQVERTLQTQTDYPGLISRCAVVGNRFLNGDADVVCLIVELTDAALSSGPLHSATSPNGFASSSSRNGNSLDERISQVNRAVANVNRTLPPPLRISWSRVLVLEEGRKIPVTKKGEVWRKMLESEFGEDVKKLLATSHPNQKQNPNVQVNGHAMVDESLVRNVVLNAVSRALGLSGDVILVERDTSFAEFGMDSTAATSIVKIINQKLDLNLPANTCHVHIDLDSLVQFVCDSLGIRRHDANGDANAEREHPIPHANSRRSEEDIVIVGQAFRLPGGIDDVDKLWEALIEKRDDLMVEVPKYRWDHSSFYSPPRDDGSSAADDGGTTSTPGGTITFKKAGFIDVTSFDNTFFGISPSEAICVTPSIRLTLEVAFEALENSNIPISKIKGSKVGTYVFTGSEEGYQSLLFHEYGWNTYSRFFGTGSSPSTACGRLSYLLDVHGPAVSLDTACSGGLVAVHEAVEYLRSGEGECAIVVGANTHCWPGGFAFISAQKMSSPTSRCSTFTNEADGYVPAEAAIGLILKTHSAAVRDGDNILGFIKSTSSMHNGRTQGLVAPSMTAQMALQRSVLRKAGIAPADIDFVETHGTGTILGDAIEIQAINNIFRSSHTSTRPLVLGAAKTCLGHTEMSAGVVGIAKTLLSFKHGVVPGLVHLKEGNMNPEIDGSLVPLNIPIDNVKVTPNAEQGRYNALVLAYGFAGSIAAAVLESPKPITPPSKPKSNGTAPLLFVVSAKTEAALTDYIECYIEFCSKVSPDDFASVCYTACVGREHYRCRFACVVTSLQDLLGRLKERLSETPASRISRPHLLVGFAGQGTQYQGMARSLDEQFIGFRSIVRNAARAAEKYSGYPIAKFLLDAEAPTSRSIDESEIAQICIFVYQYSVSHWLASLGVQPNAVVGHSIGEIAASVLAGAFSFEVAIQFVVERAKLLKPSPSKKAGMAAIAANAETVEEYIRDLELEDQVEIAVYNGPESHVVSGRLEGIQKLVAEVKKDGIRAVKLNVDQGFHSRCIENAVKPLGNWLAKNYSQEELRVPLFSTALARKISVGSCLPMDYWVNHARKPVLFSQCVNNVISEGSLNVILDIGPQRTFTALLQPFITSLRGRATTAASPKQGGDQVKSILNAVAILFENNINLDFASLYAQFDGNEFVKTSIPTYPFQRRRFFPSSQLRRYPSAPSRADPSQESSAERFIIDQALFNLLSEHQIEHRRVLPGAFFAALLVRSTSSKFSSISHLRFHRPLVAHSPNVALKIRIENGDCTILESGANVEESEGSKICSGALASRVILLPSLQPSFDDSPSQIWSRKEVYDSFNIRPNGQTMDAIHFGPHFQNIRELRLYADHVDGHIQVESLSAEGGDDYTYIRQLDPCLHMFGAIAQLHIGGFGSEVLSQGMFLPASMQDFVLYVDVKDIPQRFICRYHLPIKMTRNNHVGTTRFEILSEAGELLGACGAYSVAWVPTNASDATREPSTAVRGTPNGTALPAKQSLELEWLSATWHPKDLPDSISLPSSNAITISDVALIHVGFSPFPAQAALGNLMRISRDNCHFLSLDSEDSVDSFARLLAQLVQNFTINLVLDTRFDRSQQGSIPMTHYTRVLLRIMKTIVKLQGLHRVENVIIVSESLDPVSNVSSLGPILQGMLRVFRAESALGARAWAIEIPNTTVEDFDVARVIASEIVARKAGRTEAVGAYSVSYRSSDSTVKRYLPVLEPVSKAPTDIAFIRSDTCSGIWLVIGMGSIGSQLGSFILKNAGLSTRIVFLGRRPESDPEVSKQLTALRNLVPSAKPDGDSRIAYTQLRLPSIDELSETATIDSLKETILAIRTTHGPIKYVIHTAAVVQDALIHNMKESTFIDVLDPKVGGGLALNQVFQPSKRINGTPSSPLSQQNALGDELECFVTLTSISTPFGNIGQAAYAGANSFLDALMAERHLLCGGRGALSLQLGAWESKLVDALDAKPNTSPHSSDGDDSLIGVVNHSEGIPLILRAIYEASASLGNQTNPVQMIVKLNASKLAKTKLYREDSLFHGLVAPFDGVDVQHGSSSKDVEEVITRALRRVLELAPQEPIDLQEPLTAYGVDSISFSQVRGLVLKDVGIDLPISFLGDSYKISDLISYAQSQTA